jgi:uncharacterized protein (TIGR02246 family)
MRSQDLCRFAAVCTFIAVALAACSSPSTAAKETNTTAADEAAIRQTIADIARRVNADDISFVDVFADDAIIIGSGGPDVVGAKAIRALYTDLMKQATLRVNFTTAEVTVADGLAMERGNYTLVITDKATGKVLQNVKNNHMHIMKKQPDGTWKTWRMMTSRADAPAEAQAKGTR